MPPGSASWQPQSPLITPADLPRLFAQHRVVVVHCDAGWDRYALSLDSKIQEARRLFAQEVGFYALDIDAAENREFCQLHEVYNVPACVCFVNGVFEGAFMSDVSEAALTQKVRALAAVADVNSPNAQGTSRWKVSLGGSAPHVYSQWLTRFPWVAQCVTLRNDYDNENNMSFSAAVDGVDGNVVRENRTRACRDMRFEPARLVVPAQTHGANVAVVGAEDAGCGALSPDTAISNCDALVTNTPGLLLGITVADCLPIFFLDPINNVIGIAHSGWRGTAGRIVVNTLQAMTIHFGTHPAQCLVAIGPGIGPDDYEVDRRVYDGFARNDAQADGVFTPARPEHWRLDLYAAVTRQLGQAGVPAANFDICPYRTHRDTRLFFSHRLERGCGRMGAFIGLRVA